MSESGYLINEEDRDFLDSLPSQDLLFSAGDYQEIRLDPRKLIRIENQASQESCAGHSLSSILEWCYTVATGGEIIQYSRAMAYYEAQRISGIRGDSGSTISAGVKLGMQTGLCIEELWKYPARYDNTRPANYQAVLDNASKHKVGSATKITTYEGYRVFLGAGLGGVHNGIAWGNGMNRAVVESFSPGGGGHAIAGLCLSERTDTQGRPYVWIANSWGLQFGSRDVPGWQEWSPNAVSQMLRHQWTEMVGLSDMAVPKPRKFNLAEWKERLRS
jgi:hypothetical protein